MLLIKKFKITEDTFMIDENQVSEQVKLEISEKYSLPVSVKLLDRKIDNGELILLFELIKVKPKLGIKVK